MKLLLFSHELPPMIGGAGTYTYELAIALSKMGHKVYILSGSIDNLSQSIQVDETLRGHGIVVTRYNWRNKTKLWFLYWNIIFKNYIKNFGPFDQIIFCNYTSNIIGSKVFEIINCPYKIVIHGSDIDYFFTQPEFKYYIMFSKRKMKNFFQKAESVIAVSDYLKDILLNYIPELQNTKTIYHGIDLTNYNINQVNSPKQIKETLLKKYKFNGNEKIIFNAARLVEGKGQDVLIRTFAKVVNKINDVVLIIAGEGPDLKRLKRIAVNENVSKFIIFTGALRKDEMINFYAISDLYVMLSRIGETFGIVFIEAMAMNTPVIGTRIGGIPEVIEDGVSGYLVEPNDEMDIYNKITILLTNKKQIDSFVINGNNRVHLLFESGKMAENTIR